MAHYAIQLKCDEELAETVSALLQEQGYSGSSYEDGLLTLYCPIEAYDRNALDTILEQLQVTADRIDKEEDQNWNELWEKNFVDLQIEDIHIRAPFHQRNDAKYDIVIMPKMAFGTGHHATTQLMLLALKQIQCANKTVLDMGCGSGILAIFASHLGAREVLAIDYDPYSVENSLENTQLNKVQNVKVKQADDLQDIHGPFDMILSNIIRSVNLQLLPAYADKTANGGYILLSGLLKEDQTDVVSAAEALNLHFESVTKHENWIQLTFRKP